MGLTRLIIGGSLRALRGSLNEFSSVMNVMKSSKSAKLGAWKVTPNVRLIPGATSPVCPDVLDLANGKHFSRGWDEFYAFRHFRLISNLYRYLIDAIDLVVNE